MAEFRVKWEYNFADRDDDDPGDFYYCVDTLIEACLVLDVLRKYDRKLGLNDAQGSVQFNHPELGWVPMDPIDAGGNHG